MATKQEESNVTQEMQEAAEAQLAELNEKRNDNTRTFSRGNVQTELKVSDLYELPATFDVEGIAPTSYLAQPEGEITGNLETQRFSIVEERLAGLLFDRPARPLERGRTLRVVKWLKPTGTLVQLPFEPQVNNTAAGNISDAIGVRKFQRRGGVIFFDFETGQPIYCFARNCWAAAMVDGLAKEYPQHASVIGSGYCSRNHFVFVEPSRARKWFQEGGGMFEADATTSQNLGR